MRRRTRSRSALAVALAVAFIAAACSGSGGGSAESKPAPGRENVSFYYQQVRPGADLTRLGKVKIVVAAPQVNGKQAVQLIHSTGARAYRYLQTYWLPASGYSDDPQALQQRDWWFCSNGSRPAVGRTDQQGRDWYFYDMNDRAALDHLDARLAAVKAEGWDGVFFDRGFAALTGSDEPANTNVWDQVSSCTSDPVQPGATFADAYVGATRRVHQAGLELMMNYGGSPFSTTTPLRPDSKSAACRNHQYDRCPRLDDVWPGLNWVLDEAIAHPRDQLFEEDYQANRRNEQDAQHGGQTVGLLTTASLGVNDRPSVFFEWSRAKLFAIPLAVNTGEGGCQGTTVSVCNRHQLYPELADVAFGAPVQDAPQRMLCQTGSTVNCLWVRRYSHGMSVVNVSPEPVTAALDLGVDGCRVVTSVWSGDRLEHGKCVDRVRFDVPAWSGRPLVYSSSSS